VRDFLEAVMGVLIIFLVALFLLGFSTSLFNASPTKTQAKIIDSYRTGIGLRKVITILEMQDGTRRQISGKFGEDGETITIWISGDDISVDPPK